MAFELPKLTYAYDALEPHIDARTMEIHHSKHHAGYTNNLNAAIEGTPLAGKSIEAILSGLDLNNKAVRNNGGGFYNHRLFWE
ncbi:MAG: superoxide dismutase, partial [Flavobacteriaceae bacterium]|nr:superoxide dismutase [Flavobacteriaceae bacterium]